LPELGTPAELMFSNSGDLVYLRGGNRFIRVADARSGQVLHERQLDGEITDWTLGLDGDVIYVAVPVMGQWLREGVMFPLGSGVVIALDGATLQEIGRVPAGANPQSIRAVRLSR
jgi:hypothetical protein